MEKIVRTFNITQSATVFVNVTGHETFSWLVNAGSLVRFTVIEPEKKKLDWSKIPVNTVVSISDDGEVWNLRHFFRQTTDGIFQVFGNGKSKDTNGSCTAFSFKYCKLIEQETFTYWPGGECPLPDGVMVDIVFRNGNFSENRKATNYTWLHGNADYDIIAYRIIGLADGWEY